MNPIIYQSQCPNSNFTYKLDEKSDTNNEIGGMEVYCKTSADVLSMQQFIKERFPKLCIFDRLKSDTSQSEPAFRVKLRPGAEDQGHTIENTVESLFKILKQLNERQNVLNQKKILGF